ncbi:L-lactate permease [Acetomicrobium sp.]|jgi:lactate permease|uniref:L-lactate permease n=1 Tax=Acetomicrobium sp. TaxID=1872099 RepID=UPI001B4D57C1|nr:L-lactate permease [Acetomicrobium sp.]MBP8675170.1 L-lactate permease [Acetomicrobium sp.]MDI9378063.1 L-lactate permease [Synergistota bacterium]MDR9769115.1 L-lactate permease [Acetomicrobium sp.]
MQVNFFMWICASLPILAILILMVGFKWSASKAGPIGFFVALAVAVLVFKANFHLLANSNAKGFVMAFYVLYIVWGALLLYNVVDITGGIESIGATFMAMTKNKILQLLMIGFAFVTFLQGVAGFGVPVAVGAPLLIGMGFDPVTAVAVALIGHAWAVTFGDMAASFASLQQATGLSAADLAPWCGFFIALAGIFCGMFAVHAYGGTKALRQGIVPTLVVSLSMSISLWFIAQWEPTLATFLSGIIGMVVTAVLSRVKVYNTEAAVEASASAGHLTSNPVTAKGKVVEKKMPFNLAFAPYYSLIIIVLFVKFVPGVEDWLKNLLVLKLKFGEYSTGLGWVTPAGSSTSVGIFSHAGAFLFYASFIGILIYRAKGIWKAGMFKKLLSKVVKGGVNSSIATTSMVLMAFIMVESGMTYMLAKGVADALGSIYPIFIPLVGVLGAFMTGSNTNSNVMFGAFQVQVANILGISTLISAAAQTAGGSIGSMLAPSKVIVGTSTVGLTGREGEVIGKTLRYCVTLALILGIVGWVMLFILCRHVY